MRILETILGNARNKYVGANRHTQVVGFSEQKAASKSKNGGSSRQLRRAFR
jgi:hypothetical protein